ncbi:MAG: acyl carrier protein phosphodiesterase [Bacteroidales bacterium]|nr:acyl carrier protein phosphodiesterase [Bacteroidales bacterium]
MNYLMHVFLSGNDPLIQIGNFVADHVKGSRWNDFYPEKLMKGIFFHRQIDRFSDTHMAVKKAVELISPYFIHYSSVVVDIYFDHFLILYWDNYSKDDLKVFVQNFYRIIEENYSILPEKSKKISQKIIQTNWLMKPADLDGLKEIFVSLKKRTSFENKIELAPEKLVIHYHAIEGCFLQFMPDILHFAELHKRYFAG